MDLSRFLLTCTVFISFIFSQNILASSDKKEDKKPKTVSQLIKDKTQHDGFLNFYQDPKDGSLLLSINESQLDKPMIYFVHTVNGVLDAGHFKGAFRETKMLEFRKRFDRIEIITMTPRYYLDDQQAISRSKGTNISPSVLASMKIKATNKKKGEYIVEVDPVFLSESLHKVSPYPRPKIPGKPPKPETFKVGKLSKDKTKYMKIRSYPKNSDVVVEYIFDNESPSVRGGQEITDPRSVVVQMQHSFIQLPENDFVGRPDDPRIGYFTQQFDDLTSNKWVPYRDVINRWNLVKKDPSAAISEPVEPILWWIENTTPVEWRDTIKDAALQWNIAFEKAGFKNALQIKVQPDDTEWEAGDIRYNVLRWTASPRPPFGGYGPSVANPLTGQIIASDIMLEYVYLKNRLFQDQLYTSGADSQSPLSITDPANGLFCSAGFRLNGSLAMASIVLQSNNGTALEGRELVKQALTSLVLHEIGHTLGLNHNMKASQINSIDRIHDAALTQGNVTGSVMDYAPLNIAPPGIQQGDYADTKPGSYDLWAIEYGYSTSLKDSAKEEARLSKLLSRSTEPELVFGNDADDMRAPGRHIDPRVMIGDMSSDAIQYGLGQIELVNATLLKLKAKTTHEGESYQELTVGLNFLLRSYFNASVVASRYIGGVYVDRAMVGQEGASVPYSPVSIQDQKRAMKLLSMHLFAPEVLQDAKPLFAYLQTQRRGFNNYGKNEDPKLHAMLLNAQKKVLAHVLHKNVLQRLTDSELYGNEYDLNQMLGDLTEAMFSADNQKEVTSHRQNIQHEYVKQLISISGLVKPSAYDYFSQAAATNQLKKLKGIGLYQNGLSTSTRAHRDYLRRMINNAFQSNKS